MIGPWEPLEELGRGAFGRVLRARDAQGREVALKVLLPPVDPDTRQRFQREAQVLSGLSHPALVRVVAHGGEAEPWIALELLPGGSLEERVRCEGPLSSAEALALARQLAGGLAALHEAGLVHRDVKPENVLYRREGSACLCDLGLSRGFQPGATRLTATGEAVGTPSYIAPEQAEGLPVGPAADVYGLGATLYFALSGRPPWEGPPLQVLERVVRRDARPEPLARLRPGLDPALVELIERCLARAPGRRPPTGRALAMALEGLASPAQPAGRAWRRSALLLLPFALALGGWLALLASPSAPPTPSPPRPPLPAVPVASAAVAPEPPSLRARRLEVARLVQEGRVGEVLPELDRLIEEDPTALDLALRAACRRDAGQPEAARVDLLRALELDPGYVKGRVQLAFVLLELGDPDGAWAELTRAEELGCDPGELAHARSEHLFGTREYARARDEARRMVELAPASVRGWIALGRAEMFTGEDEAAERDLSRALALDPGEARASYFRGLLRLHRGDRAGALGDLRLAARRAPTAPWGREARKELRRLGE